MAAGQLELALCDESGLPQLHVKLTREMLQPQLARTRRPPMEADSGTEPELSAEEEARRRNYRGPMYTTNEVMDFLRKLPC